jgi:hypothetical protein
MHDVGRNQWSLAVLFTVGTLGLFGAHIGWALLGGTLLGIDLLMRLLAVKRRYPQVRTGWKVVAIYSEAFVPGNLAAIGAWACGALVRSAFFQGALV